MTITPEYYALLAKATLCGTEYAICNYYDALRVVDWDPAWGIYEWHANYSEAFEACAKAQRDDE